MQNTYNYCDCCNLESPKVQERILTARVAIRRAQKCKQHMTVPFRIRRLREATATKGGYCGDGRGWACLHLCSIRAEARTIKCCALFVK